MTGKRSLRYASDKDMPAPMRALYAAQMAGVAPPVAPGEARVTCGGRQQGRTTATVLAAVATHAELAANGELREVEMNKTEARYAQYLEARRAAGEVVWYAYEAFKLRLAERTFYTPDFAVLLASGRLECHEVKGGHWEDDARVKIKVAARLFPFRFHAFQWRKGEWSMESF